jgi:hypothetical protein
VDPEVWRSVEGVAGRMRGLGHEVMKRDPRLSRMGGLIPAALLDRARRDEARHAAHLGELFRDHDFSSRRPAPARRSTQHAGRG